AQMEQNYRRALSISGGDHGILIGSPIAVGLYIFIAVLLAIAVTMAVRKRRRRARED
ncbi:MAG: tripartite tricarboxylate transporter permease, partial [Gammaproteobacteria bacterium]|nr:tripartite tricarboxylate transporter permease [Gammaproteobacteria bacterium]